MDSALQFLNFLTCTASTFFIMSAILVTAHCFYDTGFLWTKKKCFVLLLISLVDALILNYIAFLAPMWGKILSFILLSIIATYDFQGKKWKAFLIFLLFFYLITICANCIFDNSYFLLFPEKSMDYLAQVQQQNAMDTQPIAEFYDSIKNFLQSFKTSFSASNFSEFWENITSIDMGEPVADIAYPETMRLFYYGMNGLFFGSIFYCVYNRLYKRGIAMKCGKREVIFAIVFPILCVLVHVCIIYQGQESRLVFLILSVMSIIFALAIPIFIYHIRVTQHYHDQTLHQQYYMQEQLAHFAQYKQSQEETVRFRHDVRNNLLCVNDLLQNGKADDARQYLQDMLHTTDVLRPKFVSGDEMLDCIIGVKAGNMAEQNIQFFLDGVLAGGLQWKPIDVCVVFANALDNAMEACMKLPTDERKIFMNIKSTAQYWFVSIENPVTEKIDTAKLFQGSGGYSSKPNAENHGIGTYNMKRTVENYGGVLKAQCDDHTFTLEIMIDKSSPE